MMTETPGDQFYEDCPESPINPSNPVLGAVSLVVGLVVPTRWLKAFAIRYGQRPAEDYEGLPDSWIPPAYLSPRDKGR